MLSMNFFEVTNVQYRQHSTSNAHSSHLPDQKDKFLMIDNDSYDKARQISNRMSELYNDELRGFLSNSTDVTRAKLKLAEALVYLNENLDARESPYKIMENIHGVIHPNLQIAFNLTLKR
jgi:hypothetical protein